MVLGRGGSTMFWNIIGLLAATLTMFAFLPQLSKALKTKTLKDVSLLTLFQLAAGVSLWIIYGVYRKDIIIIIANTVTLISLIILLGLYFIYNKKYA